MFIFDINSWAVLFACGDKYTYIFSRANADMADTCADAASRQRTLIIRRQTDFFFQIIKQEINSALLFFSL